jgi:hypothetical protein
MYGLMDVGDDGRLEEKELDLQSLGYGSSCLKSQ